MAVFQHEFKAGIFTVHSLFTPIYKSGKARIKNYYEYNIMLEKQKQDVTLSISSLVRSVIEKEIERLNSNQWIS